MKVDCIFCGDIHLMEHNPVTRIDNIEETQWIKIDFISALQKKYDCPVYCAGDFFDYWKPSPALITETIKHIPDKFFTIFGDHDLPSKNLTLAYKSGLTTLETARKLKTINGGHGENKESDKLPSKIQPSFTVKGKKVFLWHILTWKKELPFPDCKTSNAKKLLKMYPQFDLIVTGDNHKPFIETYKGRTLLNVGSMMRIRADQIDYKPAVWLYDAEKNKLKPVYLPIKDNVISREHIEESKERSKRIDAFISKLNTQYQTTMNFKDNLIKFFNKNKTKNKIKKLINKHIEP